MSIKSFICNLICKKLCNNLITSPVISNNVMQKDLSYGWKKDQPDQRDIICKLGENIVPAELPTNVDLRKSGFMPHVYDQGRLGSCTANSISAALQFDRAKQNLEAWNPSRLFIYYYERILEGTVGQDAGAALRDGFKVINTTGYAKETSWPYDVSKFAIEPNQQAQDDAKQYKTVTYQSVPQTPSDIQSTLAQGFPVCFGITVYKSFESSDVAGNGVVPMPRNFERSLGGHAILLVGYDTTQKRYTFRNSWGPTWGDGGYGYLPFDYVHSENLASDFWVVQTLNN